MVTSNVSRLGFGAAKCGLNPTSITALQTALQLGIRTIDTAPNYGVDGASERLIGKILSGQPTLSREEVNLTTKFGYFPSGSGMEKLDAVPIQNSGFCYSLHPEVMRRELSRSLERLQTSYIDVLFVHNPEHYLAHMLLEKELGSKGEGEKRSVLSEERRKLKGRLQETFTALEEEVASGRIKSYGVSSNAFSLLRTEDVYMSFDEVYAAARVAAKNLGKSTPSLSTIQLPMNLMEPEGTAAAAHARSRGVEVVVNRPLTAVVQDGLYRLVDTPNVEPPVGYMEACKDALEYFNLPYADEKRELTPEEKETQEGCNLIQDLIRDMNRQLIKFTSFTHYETELERRIIPMIHSTFEGLDEEAVDKLQNFFSKYGEMVRYNTSARTRELICSKECPTGPHALGEGERLQEYAIRWLLAKDVKLIKTVLVGMRTEEFVHSAVKAAGGTIA